MQKFFLFTILVLATLAATPADGDVIWKSSIMGSSSSAAQATAANFQLKYAPDTDQTNNGSFIHFELQGTSSGYMSIGIMSGTGMANIDILSFEYQSGDSSITVTDRWSTGKFTPPADTTNTNNFEFDAVNSSFSAGNNSWVLKWSRQLETNDSTQDLPIYCGKNAVVIATSSSSTFSMHSLYQYTELDINISEFTGCNNAPQGWTDWFSNNSVQDGLSNEEESNEQESNEEESENENDDNESEENENEENSQEEEDENNEQKNKQNQNQNNDYNPVVDPNDANVITIFSQIICLCQVSLVIISIILI